MATMTFEEKQQKQLLKKFHTLLGQCGIGQDGKEAILVSYGVKSSKDLSAKDLLDICNKLAIQANPKLAEQDRWRKRVIKSIFAYYEASGRQVDMQYVKATACRASGYQSFNDIPVGRLDNLYNLFRDKVKDAKVVSAMAWDEELEKVYLN